jgi:hypothetical protein
MTEKRFIKGIAETTSPSSVGDGEDVDAWFDEYGRLVVTLQDTSGNALNQTVKPFDAMIEGGLTELVGKDEEVNTDDYGASVGVSLAETSSGEILSFAFYASEEDSGAVQDSAGKLLIFDADPSVSAGDTALADVATWQTVIGKVSLVAGDWTTDANGGVAYVTDVPVPFHSLATLYFAWFHEDATDLNDAAGDDEVLDFNFWYRRDS